MVRLIAAEEEFGIFELPMGLKGLAEIQALELPLDPWMRVIWLAKGLAKATHEAQAFVLGLVMQQFRNRVLVSIDPVEDVGLTSMGPILSSRMTHVEV